MLQQLQQVVSKMTKSDKRCHNCGKLGHLIAECRVTNIKCFNCGQKGHYKINCPQQNTIQNPQLLTTLPLAQDKGKEKLNVISEGEVLASTDVISDILVNTKMSTSLEQAKKEYTEFEEKVKRSVLLSNLSPEVTAAVLKMALEQFGNVVNVEFIPNLNIPYDVPQCALVEMEDAGKASKVIKTMKDFPFMISGMPRPVCASPAKAEMFTDRPALPGRKINFRWVDKSHSDFEVAERLKKLCSRHIKESFALAQLQLEEEEKLGKQQEDMVASNYKKHEMIELLLQDGIATKLAHRYGIDLSED